jgi:hypothetical protein
LPGFSKEAKALPPVNIAPEGKIKSHVSTPPVQAAATAVPFENKNSQTAVRTESKSDPAAVPVKNTTGDRASTGTNKSDDTAVPVEHKSGTSALPARAEPIKPPEDPLLAIIRELNMRNAEAGFMCMSQQWEEARASIDATLADCLKKLPRDHWMAGRLLSTLAYIELHQGETYNARYHLETAAQLVSEWPGICDHDQEVIDHMLKYCREQLGF